MDVQAGAVGSAESPWSANTLFEGPGETRASLRGTDWASTPLGPVESWPVELRTAARMVLLSRVPTLLWWGPDLVQICNDAYRQQAGDRVPVVVGKDAAGCWAEVWTDLAPQVDRAWAGQSTCSRNQQLYLNRQGYLEEAYWTFSFRPIRGGDGEVAGLVVVTTDVTAQVLEARRLETLPGGFAVRYEPAVAPPRVGGDWYDLVRLDEDLVGVVVGDCVGRGPAAAAVRGRLRTAFRAELSQTGSPARTLGAMNGVAELIPGARCTTVLCVVVDEGTGTARYASVGHLPGIAVHVDGATELLDGSRSVPLTVLPTAEYPETSVRLRTGSTLLLFSDGLVERRGEELGGGTSRTLRVARDVRNLSVDRLVDQVLAAALLGGGHGDGVVVLAYRLPPPAPLCLSLAADTQELAPMRARLNEWLVRAGAPDTVADRIVLAATEACSNAVEHGYGFDARRTISVRAQLTEGRVELEIRDAGSWRRPLVGPSFRGRGRTIMEALMDELTIEASDRGTTVRMVKEIRGGG